MDLHPGLLNERWEGMPLGIGNDQYIVRGSTPVLGALRSGSGWRSSYGNEAQSLSTYKHLVAASIFIGTTATFNTQGRFGVDGITCAHQVIIETIAIHIYDVPWRGKIDLPIGVLIFPLVKREFQKGLVSIGTIAGIPKSIRSY